VTGYAAAVEQAAEGTFVVAPSGELDAFTAPELKTELVRLVESTQTRVLVVDLSAIAFLDSTALGVLLGTLKRLRERGGQLRLVRPRPDVLRIFEVTALDRVLPLYASRDEALRDAMPPRGA
jgi:anti-sigma B factor antagonist